MKRRLAPLLLCLALATGCGDATTADAPPLDALVVLDAVPEPDATSDLDVPAPDGTLPSADVMVPSIDAPPPAAAPHSANQPRKYSATSGR